MWKKAMLPLLLLLLLTALLLAQFVATESTQQPPVNAKDISTSNSSTEHSAEIALDINDNDDHNDDDEADEATVETYEDDDWEESSEVRKKVISQLKETPSTNEEDFGAGVSEEVVDDDDDGNRDRDEDSWHGDEGSGVGDGEASAFDEGSGDWGEGGDGDSISDSYGEGDDVGVGVGGDVDEGSGEAVEVPPLKIRGRDRLAIIMIREVTRLIDYALEQQRSVVNQFLQDDTIEMVKCATMEAVKNSCVAFMAGVRDALKMEKGKDFPAQYAQFGVKTLIARNFEAFVQQHNTTRIKQPTAENVIIDNALKKAGVLQIELEMQKRFVEFSKLFNTTVGEYVDRLLPNERTLDKTLVEWYGEFNAATNVSSQVIALTKFLPLYKDMFSIEIESD